MVAEAGSGCSGGYLDWKIGTALIVENEGFFGFFIFFLFLMNGEI